MNFHRRSIVGFLFGAILILVLPLIVLVSQERHTTDQHAAGIGMPYIVGNKIIDGSGNPLIIRGVQIPSEFNLGWSGGGTIPTILGPQVMQEIHVWNANALRLPVRAYDYQKPGYMTALDTVVQNANNQGIYVILANFEGKESQFGASAIDQQGLMFWQFMANHFKNNPMVMFDLINEPQNTSYAQWLNGDTVVVGMQQVVNAIRADGAKQIIIAEWIDQGVAGFAGFTSFINDPNIMYSMHMYFKAPNLRTTTGWDSNFGNLSAQYPVLIGEWALLPTNKDQSFCSGLDASSGTVLVDSFLQYMQQHNVNWTAQGFFVPDLIKDETTFSPTVLTDQWNCGGPRIPGADAGMGSIIKNYLLIVGTPSPLPSAIGSITQTLTPTTSVTSSPIPTRTGGTPFTVTICPHGLGNCGDNVNPSSVGNTNPLHTTRNILLHVTNTNNSPALGSPFPGQVTYIPSSKNFQGIVTIPDLLSGSYLITINMVGFLSKQLPGIIMVNQGQQVTVPSISLVTGDIGPVPGTDNAPFGDNQLDITDYNVLLSCFGSKMTTSSCLNPPTQEYAGADINDDGQVDGADYNEFLRELSVQTGQ